MKIIVDIPDIQIEILDKISKKEKISRSEVIRRALTNYIAKYSNKESFGIGIWKGEKLDSMKYQRKVRDEWE